MNENRENASEMKWLILLPFFFLFLVSPTSIKKLRDWKSKINCTRGYRSFERRKKKKKQKRKRTSDVNGTSVKYLFAPLEHSWNMSEFFLPRIKIYFLPICLRGWKLSNYELYTVEKRSFDSPSNFSPTVYTYISQMIREIKKKK